MTKPKKTKVPTGWFQPENEEEHERGNQGEEVEDRCRNCHQPFMAHYNGTCPE